MMNFASEGCKQQHKDGNYNTMQKQWRPLRQSLLLSDLQMFWHRKIHWLLEEVWRLSLESGSTRDKEPPCRHKMSFHTLLLHTSPRDLPWNTWMYYNITKEENVHWLIFEHDKPNKKSIRNHVLGAYNHFEHRTALLYMNRSRNMTHLSVSLQYLLSHFENYIFSW